MPQLLDPNFKRSVVLLIHHDEEGTFGLVVNRPTEIPIRTLCEDLEITWNGDGEERLCLGGPVQPDTGWVVFDDRSVPEARTGNSDNGVNRLAPGIAVCGSLEILRGLAPSPPEPLRMMLGYSGWGPHQLEDELAEGAWLLAPLCTESVFRVAPDEMWEHVVRGLGVDPSSLVATPGVH